MLWNCLKEDVCLYRPNARSGGEFEWLKTLGVRKPLKKTIKQHLHHHMLFGRVSIKILLAHPKTNSSIFSYQTRLELQMGLTSMVRWNKKMSFLAAHTQDGLVNTGIKVPHVYKEIYGCIRDVVGLYFCWRSWTSCLVTWHHGFYQIPTDKKSVSDWLC